MRFEHPPFLWLLLPALIAVGIFFLWSWRTRRRLIAQFVSARLLPTLLQDSAPGRLKLRLWLLLAAIGLLLLALARPQFGFRYEEVRSRGLDIVVAIDTSRSMLATDIAPTRLRRAQLAALDLKRIARADRVGLVAFAGGAFLQCPLTLDDEAFRQSVETLDVSIIPQGGTALAEAIQAALGAFKDGNDNHKVLVLFTDGEDHDGQALETAKTATAQGLRIFTVGVGTPNGDVLRTLDASGRSEFIKGPDGNAVRSKLNESLLRELASSTGGFYLQLSGAGTIAMLYERGLQPLPRSEQAAQRVRRYHERYQWLLAAAILLLLVEMLVPERRPVPRPPAHPAARGAAAALTLLLVLPFTAAAGPAGARRQYEAGKFEAARKEYEGLIKSRKDDPRLRFNAGTAALGEGDLAAAADHLNAALASPDLPLQQRAYYNLGHARYRLGENASAPDKKQEQWQESVKHFESALKLDPADADARHNLEFVQKQLEQLKQQQPQQPSDQQDQKNQDKNQEKDQQKQEPQKSDQQKQDQQQNQQDSSRKDENQKQDQSQPSKPEEPKDSQQQPQQNQGKPEDKKDESKPGQQAQPQDKDRQEGTPNQPDGAPQTVQMRMKPEDAVRLLETLKAEEKNMPFRPILRTNRQDRIFKDW
ncbi:MAG: hypothetical protein RJA22_1076 [Verrucomicrobiota bacterium]